MLSEKQRHRIVMSAIRRVRRRSREIGRAYAAGEISWQDFRTPVPFVTHTGRPAARTGAQPIYYSRAATYTEI